MEYLQEKSWNNAAVSNRKKFLARHYTYALARHIPSDRFEVVYESDLDPFHSGSPQPDVVVYDRVLNPLVAIEFSRTENLFEMMMAAGAALERYALDEFFIHDYENGAWYRRRKDESGFSSQRWSESFGLDLDELMFRDGRL